MKTLAYLKAPLGIAAVALAVFFIISSVTKSSTLPPPPDPPAHIPASIPERRVAHFSDLAIEARAAYVFDVRSNADIFTRNIDAPLPIASLTKLMTALVAVEYAPESTLVTIDLEALSQDGESGFWLDEEWRLADILDITLVGSVNDGAYAIAASIVPFLESGGGTVSFVDTMNERGRALGLSSTSFNNPTGLDLNGETEPSAMSSARDVTKLFAYMLKHHPELLEATRLETVSRSSQDRRTYAIENTNQIVDDIPLLIASKTGFTDTAGGNLVIAFDAGLGHPIIITVLGSSPEGRFSDAQQLIEATLRYTTYGF